MKDLVWVGMRESEIKYCDFIKEGIVLFGSNSNSFRKVENKNVNHNSKDSFDIIDKFYDTKVLEAVKNNPNIKFMYYNQLYSYNSMKNLGLLDHIICLNDQRLIEFVNDKFKIKKYLNESIKILDYELLSGGNIDYKTLKNKYYYDSFVISSSEGQGGSGTVLLDDSNYKDITFNKDELYMITKYCKNNIPVNIHILISEKNIILLPISIQIIEKINNKLSYKGCDYIAVRTMLSANLLSKINDNAKKIGKIMHDLGYRGIMGIDSICYEDEVYFMEINPRFQNSSSILNKALYINKLPSLQELHYNCFTNKEIKLKPFSVNYSCYIYESGDESNKIKPIETLDKFDEVIECEKDSYLYTLVYDKSIVGVL